jgi:hypothetical protein
MIFGSKNWRPVMNFRSPLTYVRNRRLLLVGLIFLLSLILMAFLLEVSAAAAPPVPATVDPEGVLLITAAAGDKVRLSCASGEVRVNRAAPDSGPASCAAISLLEVMGKPELDLQAVFDGDFPNLARFSLVDQLGSDPYVMKRVQDNQGVYYWVEEAIALGPPASIRVAGELDFGSGKAVESRNGTLNPLAPPLDTTFGAANFDTNAALTPDNRVFIPPDPIAAAGPNHVVNVVNVAIEWYNKAGVGQGQQSLQSFFTSLSPQTYTFDPKVIYDQQAGRFVVVTLEKEDFGFNNPSNKSFIFVAVSDDSDPNGTWYYQSIPSIVNVGGDDHWADYPGLAVDDQAIYITNNIFTFGTDINGGARLWIIDKGLGSGGLYDGLTSPVTIHNPYAGGGIATTTQPAHIFGSAPGVVGTFLVSYSGIQIGGNNEAAQVVRVDNPLTTTTFAQQYVPVGNIDNFGTSMPDAPQLTISNTIETNDRRALNAVWRDDTLWMTAQVVPPSGPDAGQATAHWFKLDTTNLGTFSVLDQGDVGGNDIDPGAHTFMPSVMVDQNGAMAIGFALSGPSTYAGAYYTCRASTDPPGTVQSTGVLQAGVDYYLRTFGGSRNRWGDYSGMALDPSDELTFWVYNEYAMLRGTSIGGEDGRWATHYGSFTCPSGPVTPTPSPTVTATPIAPLGTPNHLPVVMKKYNLPVPPTATPLPPAILNGNFESGPANWTEFSAQGWQLIVQGNQLPAGVTARSGIWAVWLGGDNDEISYIQQQVNVPMGNPSLSFWHWIDSPDTCGTDAGSVLVNDVPVEIFNLCMGASTGGWVEKTVSMAPYAGQSVDLKIGAITNSSLISNLFVDDVAFLVP